MAFWLDDKSKPADLSHPDFYTVVVDESTGGGYTMRYKHLYDAERYLERCAPDSGHIIPPTNEN